MNKVKAATSDATRQLRRNEKKWSKPLMDAGWTAIPSVILERQHALGLDAVDVNIILHLAKHWWYSDNLPHPGKKNIARCMEIDVSTVRRRIAKLEAVGFIKRVPRHSAEDGRQETNAYSFDGLIEKATPFAEELLEERRRQQKEKAARQMRKKPRLTIVGGTDAGDE